MHAHSPCLFYFDDNNDLERNESCSAKFKKFLIHIVLST
jgi:hypothetical protein